MDEEGISSTATPKCIATTGSTYQFSIGGCRRREAARLNVPYEFDESSSLRPGGQEESNVFKSAEWSVDGTTILTNSEDNRLRTFVLPPNLLEEREDGKPHDLIPFAVSDSPGPVYCTALYPGFSLSEPWTTICIRSTPSLPLSLYQILTSHSKPLASYHLVSRTTEAYLPAYSLSYLAPTLFATGSTNLIVTFDLHRPAPNPPLLMLPTIPSKRHKLKGGGVGMRGIVSAMAPSPAGAGQEAMLAAGTFTRWIGLYDLPRSGESIAVFSIAATNEDGGGRKNEGSGVTGLNWSPCGQYLFVSERKSNGIQVYDIRVSGRRVGWLGGRRAGGNQRLDFSVRQGREGAVEVWGGGEDGRVRVWEWKGGMEVEQMESLSWMGHDDPVTAAMVHPSRIIAATCSGQRRIPLTVREDSEGESEEPEGGEWDSEISSPITKSSVSSQRTQRIFDNTLKIWKL